MQLVAFVLVAAAGFWLVAVALLMAVQPAYGLHLMGRMKDNLDRSNWRLQFTEQGLRVLAGLALIVRAPESKFPFAFEVAGYILVITSVIVMAAPIRWHGAYGDMLLKRLTTRKLRLLSPVPAIVGAGLVYAAL